MYSLRSLEISNETSLFISEVVLSSPHPRFLSHSVGEESWRVKAELLNQNAVGEGPGVKAVTK
jgi:hypothetical protein